MDVNKALDSKREAREAAALDASRCFKPFMEGWLKLQQTFWNVQAHAVGEGFFVYHGRRTVVSISCRENRVEVDHVGAYDLGLEPPPAVHGVWPSWRARVTCDNLNKISGKLLDYIAKRS